MSNVSSPRRWPRGVMGFVCAAGAAGCLDGSLGVVGAMGGADHGTAVAAITSVPGAVQCITLTLDRPTTGGPTDFVPLRMDFPVTAGAPSTLSLGPQPAGVLRVRGAAYDEGCDGLEPATQPSWVGDAVTVTIVPGRRASIPVALRRNVDQRATVDFLETPTKMFTGVATTAAVFGDGELRLWGNDPTRGTGALLPTSPDPSVGIAAGVTDVVSDGSFLCVLDSLGVGCVGRDLNQVGGRPIRRYALPGDEVATALGATYTGAVCATTQRNRVFCWGANIFGEVLPLMSAGPRLVTSPAELTFQAGPALAVQVSMGSRFGCLVNPRGEVECWGANDYSQLGITSSSARYGRPRVAGVVEVAAGDGHACALLANGTVQCWGQNAFGQLGNDTYRSQEQPTPVAGLSGVTALSAGASHTCALLQSGTVQCWGFNQGGQLGNGTVASSPRPVTVPGLSDVVELDTGAAHTCARLRDHSLRCWGGNFSGAVGDGTIANRFVPTRVAW